MLGESAAALIPLGAADPPGPFWMCCVLSNEEEGLCDICAPKLAPAPLAWTLVDWLPFAWCLCGWGCCCLCCPFCARLDGSKLLFRNGFDTISVGGSTLPGSQGRQRQYA